MKPTPVSISELRFLSLIVVQGEDTANSQGRFQSQNWDSYHWSAEAKALSSPNVRVSISELRFLSLIVAATDSGGNLLASCFNLRIEILIIDRGSLRNRPSIHLKFQSQNWDSYHWSSNGLSSITTAGCVSISELRFLSLIGNPCQRNGARRFGFNLRIEILIIDRIIAFQCPIDRGILVSISELRFLSLIDSCRIHKEVLQGCVSISELRFLSLIDESKAMASLLKCSFQSQNWDSYHWSSLPRCLTQVGIG